MLRRICADDHVELMVLLVLAAGDESRLAAAREAAQSLRGGVAEAPGTGQILEVGAEDEGLRRVLRRELMPCLGGRGAGGQSGGQRQPRQRQRGQRAEGKVGVADHALDDKHQDDAAEVAG